MTDNVDKVEEEDLDLRDELAATVAAAQEQADKDQAVETEEGTRDEKGRFAKKTDQVQDQDKKVDGAEQKTDDPKGPAQQGQEQEVKNDQDAKILSEDRAPNSWSPRSRERWGEIPEDIRKEIIRREEAAIAGIRKINEDFAPARAFVGELSPFINEALQNQVDPSQYIGNVLNAERSLRVGTPDQRFAALVQIADNYGIPLRQALAEALGQDVLPPAQQPLPPAVQRELEEARAFRRQFQQQQQEQPAQYEDPPHIKEFASKNEFFQDVRMVMADLMEAGHAKTLDEAYKEACWRVPEVRELMLERQNKGQEREQRQQAAAKPGKTNSTNGVETKSNEAHDDDDDLHETVRKAAAAAASTRV